MNYCARFIRYVVNDEKDRKKSGYRIGNWCLVKSKVVCLTFLFTYARTAGWIIFANKTILTKTTWNTNCSAHTWFKTAYWRATTSTTIEKFIFTWTTLFQFNTSTLFRTIKTWFAKTTTNTVWGAEFGSSWREQIATSRWTCRAALVKDFIGATFDHLGIWICNRL